MLDRVLTFIRSHNWKWLYITVGVLLFICLAGGIYAYQKRDALLEEAMVKAKTRLKNKYGVDLLIGRYGFSGLTSVKFENIQLHPQERPMLLDIEHLDVSIRIFPLLFGEVKLGQVTLDKGFLTLVKKDSVSNYDFLFKKKKDDDDSAKKPTNYAEIGDKLLKSVFFKIPKDLNLTDFEMSYQDDSTSQKINVPSAIMEGGDLESKFLLNNDEAAWNLVGNIDPDDQECDLKLFSDKKDVNLPLLKKKFGLSVSFDEVSFRLNNANRKNKELLQLDGEWGAKNLKINHWRISDKDVIIPEVKLVGAINVAPLSIEIDKQSNVQVKNFVFYPYAKYVHKPEKSLTLAFHTDKINGQDFFDAIPVGLFPGLEGIQVEGDFQYDLNFSVQFDHPEKMQFSSKMDDKDLKVLRWGNANIAMLNTPFEYTAYEEGKEMRKIIVGPQNPEFTPLNQISHNMRISLTNSEDPFFYKHNGFEEKAFRLSIETNIRDKKFKRGASTISMQLVKNVFLNRNKTVVRKLEEIILVWLMEHSKQVSKDRMYEVYLNVIEWGNNVYGITEAARYYFNKKPSELTLGESIFLSSIVPRPKKGLSFFDWTGHLKPSMLRYFNTYGTILLKTGQIRMDTTMANFGFYQVELRPDKRPARPAIVDSVQTDLEDQELMMDQLDADFEAHEGAQKDVENHKKSIFDKIFGRKKEENKDETKSESK